MKGGNGGYIGKGGVTKERIEGRCLTAHPLPSLDLLSGHKIKTAMNHVQIVEHEGAMFQQKLDAV